MRLETHFLVSLFVCIIGLLTTVNGNVTYPAVDEPTNWRALGFAFGLFLVLFVLGRSGTASNGSSCKSETPAKNIRHNPEPS